MLINIKTKVSGDYQTIFSSFNRDLFESLSPPFPPVKLIRFDGSEKGDLVKLKLDFIFFSQDWTSLIIEKSEDSEEIYFIDLGIKLPFFLKSWRHKHRIMKVKDGSQVIDQIHYSTPFPLLDFLIYPFMYLQFYYRKSVYKKFFS